MCRNIKTLHNFEPPATAEEIHASAVQFVRKLSGSTRPSKANQAAFERAVEQVAAAARELLEALVTTYAALADPTRRAILARLCTGEASVTELAEPFEMSLPAVSKHLKVLERAGLIARGRQAQWRPCRLEAGPLREAADWLEHYRRFWEQSFDRLEDYLRELQAKERKNGGDG